LVGAWYISRYTDQVSVVFGQSQVVTKRNIRNFKDFLNLFSGVSEYYWTILPEFPEHSTIIRVATSEILKSHDLLNIFLDGLWLALGSILTLLLQRIGGKVGAYPSFKWTLILEF
jgi:hypothetical protein